MATKEELLRDIDIITTLSSRNNMKEADNAKKYIYYFQQNKNLKTPLGAQYLTRLNHIKNGRNTLPCLICKKRLSRDGVLCDYCMEKYTQGKMTFWGKKDDLNLNEPSNDTLGTTKPSPKTNSSRKKSNSWHKTVIILAVLSVVIIIGLKVYGNNSIVNVSNLSSIEVGNWIGTSNKELFEYLPEDEFSYASDGIADNYNTRDDEPYVEITRGRITSITFYTNTAAKWQMCGVAVGDTEEDALNKFTGYNAQCGRITHLADVYGEPVKTYEMYFTDGIHYPNIRKVYLGVRDGNVVSIRGDAQFSYY